MTLHHSRGETCTRTVVRSKDTAKVTRKELSLCLLGFGLSLYLDFVSYLPISCQRGRYETDRNVSRHALKHRHFGMRAGCVEITTPSLFHHSCPPFYFLLVTVSTLLCAPTLLSSPHIKMRQPLALHFHFHVVFTDAYQYQEVFRECDQEKLDFRGLRLLHRSRLGSP